MDYCCYLFAANYLVSSSLMAVGILKVQKVDPREL
jgi:hypothetical protein